MTPTECLRCAQALGPSSLEKMQVVIKLFKNELRSGDGYLVVLCSQGRCHRPGEGMGPHGFQTQPWPPGPGVTWGTHLASQALAVVSCGPERMELTSSTWCHL